MDFFAAQEQARKKTRWLMLWFALAVLCIVALAHLFAMLALHVWDYLFSDHSMMGFMALVMGLAMFLAMLFIFLLLMYMLFSKPRKRQGLFKGNAERKRSSLASFLVWLLLLGPLLLGFAYMVYFALEAFPFFVDQILKLFEVTDLDTNFGHALRLWDNPFAFGFSLLVGVCIVVATLYKMWQIARQGGALIAKQLGGRRIRRDTSDPAEKRLLNVIDEMAIAAGIPAPVAFVLPMETGLNAFAAGLSTRDNVIAVTQGILTAMNRDELQGIIAHEISHIAHGDSRLNLRLIGILFGIYGLTLLGRGLIQGGGYMLILTLAAGVVLCAIGSVGKFFGGMIQATASREREYLADAAAVQFTRSSAGLISALNKLRAFGSQIKHPQALAASHLFFGASEKPSRFLTSLFATHPPLEARIQRLGGKTLPLSKIAPQSIDLVTVEDDRPQILMNNLPAALPAAPAATVARDGIAEDLAPDGVAQAHNLLASLPESLRQAASSVAGAEGIVYGLFLSIPEIKPGLLSRQEKLIPPAALPVAKKLNWWLHSQPEGARYRLVWLDLVMPTLRGASQDECRELLMIVKPLIQADEYVCPGEIALYSILQNTLLPARRSGEQSASLWGFWGQQNRSAGRLLWLIARAGHEDGKMAEAAYQAAIAHFPEYEEISFLNKGGLSLDAASKAFGHLALAAPSYRKKFLEACAVAAQHDGKITPVENELLRAFAQSLDCAAPLVTLPSANQ
ncbi:MAG: M48 family metalloprotease [Zoogloeaceae bacterium]|jgi:Zn-dependent protease with chaperone function|nr:M48 family metalloprotease [Zoogloeaceae bacterium]